jgi:hypothetical protein
MASTDLPRLVRRARWGYEMTRLRSALLGAAPIAAIVLVAAFLGEHPRLILGLGATTAFAGAILLWYGREPQKALLPGFAAGLVPLVLVLGANHVHMCGSDGCTSLCMYACVVGGLGAALGISVVGYQRDAGPAFWLCASAIALLTGAIACSGIGYAGVAGLVLGFGAGAFSGWARQRARRYRV